MTLIDRSITHLLCHGNDQWGNHYPTAEIFQQDIERQELYLLQEDRNLCGIIVVNSHFPSQWEGLTWSCPEPAMTVHRLCVDPDWQRQRIASKLMDFAEAMARKNHVLSMRLDAYSGNPAALALYQGRGIPMGGEGQIPAPQPPWTGVRERTMTIKAVLFDLDDTLLVEMASAEEAFVETCKLARDRYGLDPIELHQTLRREGQGPLVCLTRTGHHRPHQHQPLGGPLGPIPGETTPT